MEGKTIQSPDCWAWWETESVSGEALDLGGWERIQNGMHRGSSEMSQKVEIGFPLKLDCQDKLCSSACKYQATSKSHFLLKV